MGVVNCPNPERGWSPDDMMTKRPASTLFCSAAVLLLSAPSGHAQPVSWEEAAAALRGAIDVHVHSLPDSEPRSIDAFEVARLAKRHGMRALLFKNHETQTASLAYLVGQAVPGVEAYGGIVLNRSVGGINPSAVEHMAHTTGRLGRVVWMPTGDAGTLPVSRDGELLPEVKEVLAVMAREDLALATGHSSTEEALLLVREARSMGIERVIVTHPLARNVAMTVPQQVEAAGLGAYLEYCFNHVFPVSRGEPRVGPTLEAVAEAIRAVGTDKAILSTDLGQQLNPVHTDGMISFIVKLREHGFTAGEIDQMVKANPARFLGLD